ncbi:MAG TPA: PKD domain-containing protein [Candidatus Saccharimonadales bacterium]|nr:PKD domain-containing protein [Candidatus Saccharimonadales bacterium]
MKQAMQKLGRITSSLVAALALCLLPGSAQALTNPQDNATGLTGAVASAAPSTPPTITTPTNGQTFTNVPITVSGLCKTGLLVKVFDNNVFMGSAICQNGSYSIQIDLFSGENDLVVRQYDALDQASPDSNVVRVTFNDNQFNPSGTALLILTSDYARRGANPGETLTWPISLSGGNGPYAISIDWGDNKATTLMSLELPGTFNIQHVYDTAGEYSVIIKATDKNGLTAYLQVVAVANGAITSSSNSAASNNGSTTIITKVLWLPSLIMLPLLLVSFWLGRKHALLVLRKHLERASRS